MGWLLNVIYLMFLVFASPWVLWRRWRKGKRVGGLWAKLAGNTPQLDDTTPRIWLHAVSVGEVLLLKPILEALEQHYPHCECVLSVTTATGREVADRTYPGLTVFWFPFDFTWAVRRALRRVRPRLVVLAELELWPNFLRAAKRMRVATVVVNGRLSARSFRGYRRVRCLTRRVLQDVDLVAAQQEEYARRFNRLGLPRERVRVTGSVKFDGVQADRCYPRVSLMRRRLGLEGTEHSRPLIWVVGSTQMPEEAWALDIYRQVKPLIPRLRLVLVPRHQERFDEVAHLISEVGLSVLRRSNLLTTPTPESLLDDPVILVDTLGELRYVWGLAHVAFVGGSFNDRGGQNMLEPAAYGAAVTFGPNTWNFAAIVEALLNHEAAIRVKTKEEWGIVTLKLLQDAEERRQLGERASAFVRAQQGATERTLEALHDFIHDPTMVRRVG